MWELIPVIVPNCAFKWVKYFLHLLSKKAPILAVFSIFCYCFCPTLISQCMFFNINVSVIDLLETWTAGSVWWILWSHSTGKVLVCVLIKNTWICSFTWESNQHKAFPKLLICNLLQNINGGLNHFSELHLSLFSM